MKILKFAAILLNALELVPTGAHLAELPHKIWLPQASYMMVQQLYLGWNRFGFVLVGAIVANLVLTVLVRRRRSAFWFALAGFILITATLAIFFAWTYPVNVSTNNWTAAPSNWEHLRAQWEYSHAVNAVLTFLALCCVTAAALAG